VDEIAIVVIYDQHVRVAGAGRGDEAACEVRKDFSGGFVAIGVQKIGFESWRVVWNWIFVEVVND
jgi:hypothetical protein